MGGIGPMWIIGGLVGWFLVSHFISGPVLHLTCAASGLALRGQAGPTVSRVARSAYSYGR